MTKCPDCGGIAGKAHVCREANRKMRGAPAKQVVHVEDPQPEGDTCSVYDSAVKAVGQVKSRVGKKQLNVWIDAELVKELKHFAVERETTIEEIVAETLAKGLRP